MKMGRHTFQCWMRALHLSFEPSALVVMLVLISYSEGWPKFLQEFDRADYQAGEKQCLQMYSKAQHTYSVLFHWTLSLSRFLFNLLWQILCVSYTITDKVDAHQPRYILVMFNSSLCVCNKTSSTMCNKTRQDSWWWSDKVRIWHQVTQAAQCVTRQGRLLLEFRLLTASWNLTCARSNLC